MFYKRLFQQGILSNMSKAFHYKMLSSVVLDNISCFGSLVVRCNNSSIVISPINPHIIPNGDKAFVKSVSNNGDDLNESYKITYDVDTSTLSVLQHEAHSASIDNLHIEIPHHYDIDVKSETLNIIETDGETLHVVTENHCSLGKIKSLNTNVHCKGVLECKNVYGNGVLSGLAGVKIKKIQSKDLHVKSNSNINLSAVYCGKLSCDSSNGDIDIGSIHGQSNLKSNNGMISVSSASGDISLETVSGNIDIVIDQGDHTKVVSHSGDIKIGVTDSVSAFVEAEGASLDIPQDLLFDGMKHESSDGSQYFEGKLGDCKSSIKVSTDKGYVSFTRESLFSKFILND